ncbi:hypothetical protein QFZ40_001625 [Arthrobacter pascens]|uniref:hypothetical protein n=1 Tax=Arthrobacter pascens TaxID=1677 RepID=UPI0027823637|nr:hypothetical protein [Arthrobacter pascens]MDQ0633716.1 hypothetical protein [Arthrobacter pascens]
MSTAQLDPAEVHAVIIAVKELGPEPRKARWAHLSLCVLDATFSIGLDYDAVVSPLVFRYAEFAKLSPVIFRGPELETKLSPRPNEQTLTDFLCSIHDFTDAYLADKVLRSNTRTSTTNGILKSAATRQIAEALVGEGIQTLSDVKTLLSDSQTERLAKVEKRIKAVKGSGNQGIRTGYIWMTAGDDNHVKPDRHVLKWLQNVLGRKVTVTEARNLLQETATTLQLTPWVVDHAIWNHMARTRPNKP